MKVKLLQNLVNNGTVDNTYNWGWSNGYPTAMDSSPRFNKDRLYVPPDREFHFLVNDKTFPEDIKTHFGRLHNLSNNCVIEEIVPEVSGHTCDQIHISGTTFPNSQNSSVVDEEIVIEDTEVSKDFPSLSSDRSVPHCSQKSHLSPY